MRQKTFSDETLKRFKPYFDKKSGCWVLQLRSESFLHWIETTDLTPCTVNRPDMARVRYNFKAEAEAMIEYLRKLWSETRDKDFPDFDPNAQISSCVDLDEEKKAREGN